MFLQRRKKKKEGFLQLATNIVILVLEVTWLKHYLIQIQNN